MTSPRRLLPILALAASLAALELAAAEPNAAARPPTSRRSQRVVPFPEVTVRSPGDKVTFTLLPTAERLTFTVRLGGTTVIEPSAIKLVVDGYDLGAGVIFRGREDYETNTTYPWHGAHRTAVDRSRGARLAFTNDLAMAEFTLEVRVFDDGVGYRLIVPGAADVTRTPDEFSEFVIPSRATVWSHDLAGH